MRIAFQFIKGDLVLPATGEGPLPSAVVAKAEDGDDRRGGTHLLIMMVVVDDDGARGAKQHGAFSQERPKTIFTPSSPPLPRQGGHKDRQPITELYWVNYLACHQGRVVPGY